MKQFSLILSFVLLLMMLTNVYAAPPTIFTVSYKENTSNIEKPSLKKATLRIALYASGNSQKSMTVVTDENQSFILTNSYGSHSVVGVLSILGEPKFLRCHGSSATGKTHILIDCYPLSNKKHY